MSAILGIDYGIRKIGLAIAPKGSRIAVPLKVIRVRSQENALEKIGEVIQEEGVNRLIIGMPQQEEDVRNFSQRLQKEFELPVYEVSEYWSTKEAKRLLRVHSKDKEDAVSAMLILQTYLDKVKD